MPETPSLPVLIAGAGPVGLALGLALARRGIACEVFEAADELSCEARASTIHPPTLQLFAEWGIIDEVLATGTRVDRLQFWDRHSRRLIAEFPYALIADDTPYPFRFQRPQSQLTRILLKAIQGTEVGRVHLGHRVTDFSDRGDHVEVHLQTSAGSQTVRGSYLCGADGSRSQVRERLGLKLAGMTYEDRFLLVGTDLDFRQFFPDLGPVSYMFDPAEWVIIMHLPELVRVVFRLNPEEDADAAQAPAAIRQRIHRFLGTTSDFRIISQAIYCVHQRIAESFRRGRVVLAGDAAHINNPAGGMGMNSGIHDAYYLAQTLIAIYAGAPPSRLDEYAAARRQIAVDRVQRDSHTNYRQLVAGDRETRLSRDRELAAVAADPRLARAFLLRASMLDQPIAPGLGGTS